MFECRPKRGRRVAYDHRDFRILIVSSGSHNRAGAIGVMSMAGLAPRQQTFDHMVKAMA